MSNDLILGAVGSLQFDVVAYRLKDEYNVDASFEPITISTTRWVRCSDTKKLEEFYIAPTRVNLQLTQERWPEIEFLATREHAHAVSSD